MSKIWLCIVILVFGKECMAQSIVEFKHTLKVPVLFLKYDSTAKVQEMQFAKRSTNKDAWSPIRKNTVFSLKGNDRCHLYMQWYNPFIYRFTYSDTSYIDPRDAALSSFFDQFLAMAKITSGVGKGDTIESNKWYSKYKFTDKQLKMMLAILDSPSCMYLDSAKFKPIFDSIYTIELNKNAELGTTYQNELFALAGAKNQADFIKILDELEEVKIDWPIKLKKTEHCVSWLKKSGYEDITHRDSRSSLIFNTVISSYLNKIEVLQLSNRNIIKSLDTILQSNINNYSDSKESKELPGFYKIGEVDMEYGKRTEHIIQVKIYQLDKEKFTFNEKGESVVRKLVFETYDPIFPKVGTGFFYSNISFSEFGVASDSAGKLTVAQSTIKKESAVPALMLNLLLNNNSRYFSPMLQIGIDPTKKHPYFLLGGGGFFGANNFGISGGMVFTWKPELNTLSEGQTITSTLELEKDIVYNFDFKPGWYLGFVYKFD